jgi:hypothetical protein
MTFKYSVRTSKRTPHFTITKINWLMLFKEIILILRGSKAGYTKLDIKINTEILRKLKINSVLEHTDQYRNNWKQHVQRMDRSCVPRPKGENPLVDPSNDGERP